MICAPLCHLAERLRIKFSEAGKIWKVGIYLVPYSDFRSQLKRRVTGYIYSKFHSEETKLTQLMKIFPTFYGTQEFIAVFGRAPYLSISQAR